MSVTRVKTKWLVAWDGEKQYLIPKGELAYQNDEVLYVGEQYSGAVDIEFDASDKLVAPGFVNLHVHAGELAAARRFSDKGRREPYSLGFLNYAAPQEGQANLLSSEDAESAGLATLAELLRYGTTTFVEIGGETGVNPEVLIRLAKGLGIRLYAGKGFRSADYITNEDEQVGYKARLDQGKSALQDAVEFAERILEQKDPAVGAMLFPLQIDTCEPDLLRETYRHCERLGIFMQIHGAQGLFEYHQIMQQTGLTPIQYLDEAGALGPKTILAHGIFLSGHSWLPYAAGNDLERLAASGAALAHCPVAFARRGIALESFNKYQQRGVRIAIGTDTFPRDMIQEMRWASYISKMQTRDFAVADAWTVFSAATNVPADILGRPDLGRLAKGTRADFQLIDLNNLRIGSVHDPISALIHAGVGEDISSVVVGGKMRVENGQVLGVDGGGLYP